MNILILTSVYPQEDDEENIGVTPVVKYFAKEWVKAGHNVIVIHNSSIYPKFVYTLPEILLKKINSKFGIVIPNKHQRKNLFSEVDGVVCLRIPMTKLIPKIRYTNSQINKQYNKILKFINSKEFSPDIIIGHWENPQIPLISMLKQKFGVRTALVFHAIVYIKQKKYKNSVSRYLRDIDVFGARSASISKEVKQALSLKKEPFICYSGIDDKYFDDKQYNEIAFNKKVSNSYMYVGRLIKRKNIDVSIAALYKLYTNNNWFNFKIIGEGAEKGNLITLTNDLKLNNNIEFLGYRNRDEVIEMLSQTEVFIMISDNETFGLVYIEAMSRGCLVIASKNGGMDGIIKHGYNGFLCEQGNEIELIDILIKIHQMASIEKEKIFKNAISTAKGFKDSHVARGYLNKVLMGK